VRILVLGGTVFLGRHVVEAALASGHKLTLFNRGQHNAELFPDVEKLRGDRDNDLGALSGRCFDAVIDTSGYRPEQLQRVANTLGGSVGHYVFVSSISVYRAFPPGVVFDETAPVQAGTDGYGALKARSEEAVELAMPGRVAIVRPGLIVGPHDPTGRFTYWPRRLARGGEVLAPGRPERQVQWIDVRDLAAWCVCLAEQGVAGVFNAVAQGTTMGHLLASAGAVAGSVAQLTWLPDQWLMDAGVSPWSEMPLWIPEHDKAFGGMLLADGHRAAQAGLTARPLEKTLAATLQWARERPDQPEDAATRVATLTPEREAQLLAQAARQRP
jgi:2'-hydroxyisoflavone reductase